MVAKCLIAALGLFVFGIGCTESGAPISATASPSSDAVQWVGANGIHVGDVWVTLDTGTYKVNLHTGTVEQTSTTMAFPTRDGKFFVVEADKNGTIADPDCSFVYWDDITTIVVANTSKREVVSEFDTIRRILTPVRLSPDIERVAMYGSEIEPCETNFSDVRFMVFSVEGQELYRDNDSIITYDWHPDGRLVVVKSRANNQYLIQIETRPASYEFEDLISFTAPTGVNNYRGPVSYTHLRAHETRGNLVCRLLLEKKKI